MEKKWKLKDGDKDMIVMQHQFEYTVGGIGKKLVSSLVVKGDNQTDTAMAKTVGLPLGIAAIKILEGKFSLRGVQIPVHEDIFMPILEELQEMGIRFIESED